MTGLVRRRPKKRDALASKPIRKGLPFSGRAFQTGDEGLVIISDSDDLPLTDDAIGDLNHKAIGATLNVAKSNLECLSRTYRLEEFGAPEALAWLFECNCDVVKNANAGQDWVARKVATKCRVIYRNIHANHFVALLLLKSMSNEDCSTLPVGFLGIAVV